MIRIRPGLDRLRDVLGLIVLAAGLSTLISATIGVTSGWLGGVIPGAQYGNAWRTWWLGDAMGVLVVAPLFLVWSEPGRSAWSWRWIIEAVALLVVIGVLSLIVFGDILHLTLINFPYLVFPPLIWAAVRLGPRGAATATALVLASAIWGTAHGFGPFIRPTLHEGLFMLQAFMGVVTGTLLVLAAVTAERRQAEAAAHEQRERCTSPWPVLGMRSGDRQPGPRDISEPRGGSAHRVAGSRGPGQGHHGGLSDCQRVHASGGRKPHHQGDS